MFTGDLEADRVTPKHVAIFPPNDLVLEVTAQGYQFISWQINGTLMLDFSRVVLENNKKKFILTSTTEDDYGIYTAEIHMPDDEVINLDFFVYEYG